MDWSLFLRSLRDFNFRLADTVDIGLTAFLLYRFFLLIEGTLAVQMLLGIGMLFIVSHISNLFQLYTLNWMLRNFWSIWVLALIVLFQPELRRAFAQFGRGGFLGKRASAAGGAELIAEVVQAVREMAATYTGALIVFERRTGLRMFREMGVPLDARVSSGLLRSIFHTDSPLHDGAVIISELRLAAAGCFLPLTKRPYLSASIGTRHRAALGVTEETDAVVVVVSEETGRITVALNGQLVRDLTPETLRRILNKVYLEGLGRVQK